MVIVVVLTPALLQIVKPHHLRTEGGERLNSIHSKIWIEATTEWTEVLEKGELGDGVQPRDGMDTLLEVAIGHWWVAEKRLHGGWPGY